MATSPGERHPRRRPIQPKERLVEWTETDQPLTYVNAVEIAASVFDLVLRLGVVQRATDDKLAIKEVGRVAMSPQHAKALSALLSSRIEEYEKTFGIIPVPPNPQE